jgi:hypothetical protein
MNKKIVAILLGGIAILVTSLGLVYSAIALFPTIMEEYYNDIFRASSFETDWMFYIHPFVLSAALQWFWVRYKELFKGPNWIRALEVGLVYGMVAMLPVLWLTFSAINISVIMLLTWLAYGILQASVAGFVFTKLDL